MINEAIFWRCCVLLAILYTGPGFASEDNGACDLSYATGLNYVPWDWAHPKLPRGQDNVVLRAHFTASVAQLQRGSSNRWVKNDLDYTLRRIPNHPRALDAASRLHYAVASGEKSKDETLIRSIDCYFERAIIRNPKSPTTFYVYGLHMHRGGNHEAAVEKYQKAEELGYRSSEFYYNFGLLYFEMENLDLASDYASRAYKNGFPLPGLKRKLESAGAWSMTE